MLRLFGGPIVEIRHANRSLLRSASPSLGIRPVRFGLGIVACVGVALTLFSLLFGFGSIPTNSVGVKLRFGALSGIEDPGLTYVIPYVDELIVVPTQRLLKLEFGFSTPGASNPYQPDRESQTPKP